MDNCTCVQRNSNSSVLNTGIRPTFFAFNILFCNAFQIMLSQAEVSWICFEHLFLCVSTHVHTVVCYEAIWVNVCFALVLSGCVSVEVLQVRVRVGE